VAYELDIRMIETVSVSSYDNQAQSELKFFRPSTQRCEAGWSSTSFPIPAIRFAVRKILPKATYACLYAKPKGVDAVDV